MEIILQTLIDVTISGILVPPTHAGQVIGLVLSHDSVGGGRTQGKTLDQGTLEKVLSQLPFFLLSFL